MKQLNKKRKAMMIRLSMSQMLIKKGYELTDSDTYHIDKAAKKWIKKEESRPDTLRDLEIMMIEKDLAKMTKRIAELRAGEVYPIAVFNELIDIIDENIEHTERNTGGINELIDNIENEKEARMRLETEPL